MRWKYNYQIRIWYSKNIKSFKLYESSLSFEDIGITYKYYEKLKLEIFATVDESYLNLVKKLKQRVLKYLV